MNKQLEEAKKAIEELRDSYELHLRGWAERCLNTIQTELERLQKENNKLERANKTYFNSIQSITPVLLKDYIEKDKIREKLEKHKDYLLNQATTSNPTLDAHFRDKENYVIKILKELLEGK